MEDEWMCELYSHYYNNTNMLIIHSRRMQNHWVTYHCLRLTISGKATVMAILIKHWYGEKMFLNYKKTVNYEVSGKYLIGWWMNINKCKNRT